MFSSALIVDGFIVFFMTIFLTQLVQKYAAKLGLLDIPNNRSAHVNPTPRGAGVAMFFSYTSVLLLYHTTFFTEHLGFFIGLILIFVLGLYDDVKDSSPRLKLLTIGLAASLVFLLDDLAVDTLGHWFGFEVKLPYILALFMTIFAIVGFTNALNLIDGLDGLAGSISLVILASLYYIGFIYHDEFIMIVSFLVMAALIGFLFFNWYPASIFMGDSGSLVLGFIIASLAIKATDYISDTTVLFLAAVPIIDTIIVMSRRMQRGMSPFTPDKSHFHHKILLLKGSVDASVHILVSLQIILSVIGLLLRDKSDLINLMLFLVILFIFFQALDDRKEHRNLLVLSKTKIFFIEFFKKVTNCRTMFISAGILILVILVKIFI
jgi:UDP-GlcNAc:undecaprenyl-phosphate GlcNAc-1-phosphate transferase